MSALSTVAGCGRRGSSRSCPRWRPGRWRRRCRAACQDRLMAVRSAADRHGYWQPVFTRDIDDRVEVEGAGPRILVAGELLRELAYAHVPGGEPFVFLPGTELELPYPAEVYRVIESRAGFGAFWVKASAAAAAGIPDRIQVVPGPAGAEVWADAFIGGVLRIRVVTGNLVYKITGFDFAHRAYIAEWPPS